MSDTPPLSPGRRAIAGVTEAAVAHPWRVLAVAALLTAASIRLASGLEIRSNFDELLPSDIPSVAHIKEMVRRVGGDGSVLLVLASSDSVKGAQGKFDDKPIDLAAAKKLAPVLVQELLALGPDKIRAAQWNMRDVQGWFEDHWPLFASTDELTRARDGLRAEIKKRKLEANPLAVPLDDDDRAANDPPGDALHATDIALHANDIALHATDHPLHPNDRAAAPEPVAAKAQDPIAQWLDPDHPLPREQVAARFSQYDGGFLVNPAKTALVLNVRPAGTSLGVSEARRLIDEMRAVADKHQAELAAAHLRVGIGGSTATIIADNEAITHDVFGTAALCFSLVILSILVFFRDLRSTFSLGLAILIAVAITFGLTKLVIGYLNTQTAFLGVIVAGNGINYGLIYLARVKQLRQKGLALSPACVEGALTCAQSTLLASAASSVSFSVLIIAANRGFRHFGFIGGLGMLLCWLCTFALVPALLSLWETVLPVRPAPEKTVRVPGWMSALFAKPAQIAALFAITCALAIGIFFGRLPGAMERNLDNLTNDPLEGEAHRFNDLGQSALGKSIAGTLALLDSREEAEEFCDAIRARMKEPSPIAGVATLAGLIDGCETMAVVVPRDQPAKLQLVHEIESQLDDGLLQHLGPEQGARIRQVRAQLAAQVEITAASAPVTLLDPFRERDGQVGRLAVITATPAAHLELGPNLKAFVAAVRNVPVHGKLVEASGANVIFSDLLDDIDKEGPRTTLLSFLGVCALVLLYFRHLRTSAEVLGTLFVGVALMGGVAALLDYKINFFNFIVYPITFGIAVDYGANVAARVRERDGDALLALAEVGGAVALCSFTSIIGYASLLVSINRALRSFGHYGMIGELTSIVSALVLLPALLVIAQRHRARRGAVVPARSS